MKCVVVRVDIFKKNINFIGQKHDFIFNMTSFFE